MPSRIEKLSAMLEKSPEDSFLLYALAMEHKKAGRFADAIEYFDRTLAVDPGYCYAYHQRGLAFLASGDRDAARRSLEAGVAAANEKGETHAAAEIAAALEELESQ